MQPNVREVAAGKWPGLLLGFGLTEHQLSGKHCACPVCGGKDRFRFDDKEGRGTYFCASCGPGDGVSLVMKLRGLDFRTAAKEIEQAAGVVPATEPKRQQTDADKLEACRRLWRESKPVTCGDSASLYLQRRTGLEAIPACLRFHPSLHYRHDDGRVTRHPAMLAKVHDAGGNGVSIHRTFLTADGQKADVPTVKKVLGRLPPSSAVRLSAPSGTLGIAEGIETALAASELFGVPVWSCISAHGVETFEPPAGIEKVIIFADNDVSFTGQKSAYAAAFRLYQRGIAVDVKIPDAPGDWLDVLNASQRAVE